MENEVKKDKNLAKGLFFKKNPNRPEFIEAQVSVKTEDFIEWLRANTDSKGWCNIDVKPSKNKPGTFFLERDEWQPTKAKKEDSNFAGYFQQ